jgi:signal transduction histidine kinase
VFDLDSPVTHMDLEVALAEAAQHIFEGCDVRVDVVAPDTHELSEELRITTYRIVREALVNVRKHARASRVLVELSVAAGQLRILVRDDGRGLEATALEARAGHRGVAGMRDRASAAGGTLQLEQAAGSGAELRVVLPV